MSATFLKLIWLSIIHMFAIIEISGESICDKSMITVSWPNRTRVCLPCPYCRRGWGSTYSCGDFIKAPLTITIACVKCKRRQTFSPGRSTGTCQRCTPCRPNHKVVKKCTRSSDRRCGGCKKGYYKYLDPHMPFFSTCEKCSSCCGDATDKRIKECEMQGLPRNLQCSFLQDKRCNRSLTLPTLEVTKMLPLSKKSTKNKGQTGLKRLDSTTPATLPSNSNSNTGSVRQVTSENSSIMQLNFKNINTNNVGNGNGISPSIIVVLLIFLVLVFVVIYIIYRYRRRNPNQDVAEGIPLEIAEPAIRDTGVAREEQQANAERSRPIAEFIADKDSKYNEFCGLLNNRRHPHFIQDFDTILRGFDIIDPNTIDDIREDQHGAAQALLEYLRITKDPPVTLEQIARQLDAVGRTRESRILRMEDARLQRAN